MEIYIFPWGMSNVEEDTDILYALTCAIFNIGFYCLPISRFIRRMPEIVISLKVQP